MVIHKDLQYNIETWLFDYHIYKQRFSREKKNQHIDLEIWILSVETIGHSTNEMQKPGTTMVSISEKCAHMEKKRT